jgi:hypothetical protein
MEAERKKGGKEGEEEQKMEADRRKGGEGGGRENEG